MPYYVLLWGKTVVAYVDNDHAVIETVTASLIERCLLVYGLRVNMGIEEEVSAGGRRLNGYKIEYSRPDVSEADVLNAIRICLALLGIETEKEPVRKIYELLPTKDISEKKDKEVRGEIREEEIGFEPA